MRFVYPEFLWALLALAIPVIIHLFNFRKYKTLYFSSLRFLKFVDQQTRSTQKLKHYLVLALRLLALTSIIIAFAQPYIPVEESSGKGGKNIITIYLDNSFSMTAKGAEGELFSEAREFARKVITDASLETGFVLHTNDLSGIEKRILTKPEALEYLDKIKIGPMVRTVNQIISWERELLRSEQKNGKRISASQHVLLSDFQKINCDFSEIETDNSSFYYPVRFSPQERSNLYIDSVWFTSPVRRIGSNNELNIRVVNESDEDLANVEIKFRLENINRDIFIDIPKKSKTETIINYTEKGSGVKQAKITVNDRQLFWDDDFYFSYAVKDQAGVLIINGESADVSIERIYALEPYFKTSVISENSFNADALKNTDLIVLNGLNEITSGLTEQLVSFAQSGGSLGIIPGKEIKSGSYNLLLDQLNLPSIGRVNTVGTKIRTFEYEDPFFFGMFDKKKKELNLNAVSKSYSLSNSGQSNFFELMTLQNGQPLFVRSKNSFNAFLLATSLDPTFSSLTSESIFPAIVLRMGELSQRPTPLAVTLGKDAVYPLYDVPQGEEPVHLVNGKVDFIPRTARKGIVTYMVLSGIESTENLIPGNYQILGGQKKGSLSINLPREESRIDCLEINEVVEGLNLAGLKNVSASEIDQGQSMAKIDIDKPFEYWRVFIILALVFLGAEMLVLKLWK
jgi:hypothetical protein